MIHLIHLSGSSFWENLYVTEHISGYYSLNSPHTHPCPTCGDFRISIEQPDLSLGSFDFECKKCHTNWLVPMDLSDIEFYTNSEHGRALAKKPILVDTFTSSIKDEEKLYYQARYKFMQMYGSMRYFPYEDQYEYSARRNRIK